jgi:hypothetical protein
MAPFNGLLSMRTLIYPSVARVMKQVERSMASRLELSAITSVEIGTNRSPPAIDRETLPRRCATMQRVHVLWCDVVTK